MRFTPGKLSATTARKTVASTAGLTGGTEIILKFRGMFSLIPVVSPVARGARRADASENSSGSSPACSNAAPRARRDGRRAGGRGVESVVRGRGGGICMACRFLFEREVKTGGRGAPPPGWWPAGAAESGWLRASSLKTPPIYHASFARVPASRR